jgi:hypothetical protein
MKRNDHKRITLTPAFLTKIKKRGVKNCQNIYCKRIPAV